MKVLQIAFYSWEECIHIANALAREAEVCLMLPRVQAEPYQKLLNRAVNYQPFDKPRLRQPWAMPGMVRTLLKRIDDFQPDVVHLQKGHLYFTFALPYLRRKYPLVISIHDPRQHVGDWHSHREPEIIMDFAYRQAHRVIAHNEPMKQLIMEHLRIPEELIDITPLIALGDAADHPVATHDASDDENLILFFGRIWAYKGLAHLIEAEPLITAQVPGAKIVIAGEGENLAHYRRMMTNPDNFLVFNGWIPHEDRETMFARASVVVLPYIEATQSGIVPVAYAHGKPVVATTVGGLPFQVEDGHTGFLVPPGDSEALAARIVQLLKDKQLRRQLGANGKRKLEMECSGPVFAQQTMETYRRAVAQTPIGPGKRAR
jgi:glycosyltransferase involved in cell wall biosynthesis